MEHVSGQRLEWFFQQWVELPHTPQLTVSNQFGDGELVVRVGQEITESRPRYTVPFGLEVGLADGSVIHRRAWLEDSLLHVNIPMEEPPLYVAFDPEGGVLANVDQRQDVAAWTAQLDSAHPYARRMAMRALGEEDASQPLVGVLSDVSAPRHDRILAAKMLGRQRAEVHLIAFAEDSDAHVRKAVAEALGKGVNTQATAVLSALVQRDSDPAVRTAALASLARRDPQAALRMSRRLTRPSQIIEMNLGSTAIDILGKEGGNGDLRSLLESGRLDRLDRNALTAAVALAGRLDDGGDRASLRVARVLESRLSDVDLRTRTTVVHLLGMVGDERSIEMLEIFRRDEKVSFLVDAAQRSISEIRGRSNSAETSPNHTDARIEDLEDRLDELEEALQRLQDRH